MARAGGPSAAVTSTVYRHADPAPVSAIGVLTRIRLIARLIDAHQRRTLAELGEDASTRDLLSALRRGPPYRLAPGEIAQAKLVTPGAISQQVARAERDGLVRRWRSDTDARGVVVELTDTGRARIERTVGALFAAEALLLGAFSEPAQERLAELLRALLSDLSEGGAAAREARISATAPRGSTG